MQKNYRAWTPGGRALGRKVELRAAKNQRAGKFNRMDSHFLFLQFPAWVWLEEVVRDLEEKVPGSRPNGANSQRDPGTCWASLSQRLAGLLTGGRASSLESTCVRLCTHV